MLVTMLVLLKTICILNKLEGAYTPDGKAVSYPGNPNEPADEAEDIYIALYRVSKTSY